MKKTIRDVRKYLRLKRPGLVGEPVTVRLQPDLLSQVDAWIKMQTPAPSRPEAIRRILTKALGKPR